MWRNAADDHSRASVSPSVIRVRLTTTTSSPTLVRCAGGATVPGEARHLTCRAQRQTRLGSDVAEPAVDDQVRAGDEAGVRRGKEQHGGRDLLAGSESSERDGGGDLLPELGADGAEERGI